MSEEQQKVEMNNVSDDKDGKPASGGDNIARVMRMGTDSIPKLLLEFAVPAIAGMLVNCAYNVIDSIFLGQAMGEIGLATATVAMPVMTVFLALSMLVGNGGNALCALRMGEGKRDEAEWTLGNTVLVAMVIAVVVLLLAYSLLIDPLLSVSGATPENWDYSRTFVQIISLGYIFQTIGMGVNNFIRTAGAPNRALMTMLIGAIACTGFNFLFVIIMGWGVAGSAWATVCGQACSCASVLWYFILTKGVPIKLRRRYLKPRGDLIKMILSLGAASFILQMGMSVVSFVLNNLLNYYGGMSAIGAEGALASIGIVQRVAMFVVMPLIGVSVAAQPLLGFCYGARNFTRVRHTFWWAVGYATVLAVAGWLLIRIFDAQIIALFGIEGTELRTFTQFAMKVQLFMVPFIGFQIVASNYFQATGQPGKSIFLSLTRQILFLIPMYVCLPMVLPKFFPQFTGLDALYFSCPIADFMAIFTASAFVAWELRKLRRKEAEAKIAAA